MNYQWHLYLHPLLNSLFHARQNTNINCAVKNVWFYMDLQRCWRERWKPEMQSWEHVLSGDNIPMVMFPMKGWGMGERKWKVMHDELKWRKSDHILTITQQGLKMWLIQLPIWLKCCLLQHSPARRSFFFKIRIPLFGDSMFTKFFFIQWNTSPCEN